MTALKIHYQNVITGKERLFLIRILLKVIVETTYDES